MIKEDTQTMKGESIYSIKKNIYKGDSMVQLKAEEGSDLNVKARVTKRILALDVSKDFQFIEPALTTIKNHLDSSLDFDVAYVIDDAQYFNSQFDVYMNNIFNYNVIIVSSIFDSSLWEFLELYKPIIYPWIYCGGTIIVQCSEQNDIENTFSWLPLEIIATKVEVNAAVINFLDEQSPFAQGITPSWESTYEKYLTTSDEAFEVITVDSEEKSITIISTWGKGSIIATGQSLDIYIKELDYVGNDHFLLNLINYGLQGILNYPYKVLSGLAILQSEVPIRPNTVEVTPGSGYRSVDFHTVYADEVVVIFEGILRKRVTYRGRYLESNETWENIIGNEVRFYVYINRLDTACYCETLDEGCEFTVQGKVSDVVNYQSKDMETGTISKYYEGDIISIRANLKKPSRLPFPILD